MIKIILISLIGSFIYNHSWSQAVVKENKPDKTGMAKSQGSKNYSIKMGAENNAGSASKDTVATILLDVLFATNEDCDLYISEEFKGTVNRSKHKYIKLAPGSYVYKAMSKSTLDELSEPFVVTNGDSNEIFIDLLYVVDEQNLQRKSIKNRENADNQVLKENKDKTDNQALIAKENKRKADSLILVSANKRKADSLALVSENKRKADRLVLVSENKTKADSLALVSENKRKADSLALVLQNKRKADSLGLVSENKRKADSLALALKQNKSNSDSAALAPKEKKIETNTNAEKLVIDALLSNMISINEGSFIMGNNKAPSKDEIEHPVTITRMLFSKYELTQQEWESVMGYNPSNNKDCSACPVENVSWEEVMKFIRKINESSTKKFRLPTEAEWEYVARIGGRSEIEKEGGPEEYIKKTAWYYANSDKKTHPVGQKQPNVAGIYDLLGNVSEWCSDWYDADYYKKERDQKNPLGPVLGKEKVVRGGSYNDYSGDRFRPSLRSNLKPANKSIDIGFRLVMDVN